ncbi:hypothetical protein P885DRAFT_72229 [Corynascus similis CBS 632.67]
MIRTHTAPNPYHSAYSQSRPESSAVLAAHRTIRRLLDMRYPLLSRQSSAAVAFASELAEKLARAVPLQLGHPPAFLPAIATEGATSTDSVTSYTADADLHAVLLHHNRIHVCFDLFLHDRKPEVRQQADKSLARLLHVFVIHESGGRYRIRRSPALDTRVAQRYASIRDVDKRPRPYFYDNLNPPLYITGISSEGSLDEFEAGLTFAAVEGEEWEWKSCQETWELYQTVAQTEPKALEKDERLHGQVTVGII